MLQGVCTALTVATSYTRFCLAERERESTTMVLYFPRPLEISSVAKISRNGSQEALQMSFMGTWIVQTVSNRILYHAHWSESSPEWNWPDSVAINDRSVVREFVGSGPVYLAILIQKRSLVENIRTWNLKSWCYGVSCHKPCCTRFTRQTFIEALLVSFGFANLSLQGSYMAERNAGSTCTWTTGDYASTCGFYFSNIWYHTSTLEVYLDM